MTSVLGIDPGIANTGLAVVQSFKCKYALLHSDTVRTPPRSETGARLETIYNSLRELIVEYNCDAICLEKAYFNRNISAHNTTSVSVIGRCQLAAAQAGEPCLEVKPQKVKTALGCPSSADKKLIQKRVQRIFGVQCSAHAADPAGAAIAGLLEMRVARGHQ